MDTVSGNFVSCIQFGSFVLDQVLGTLVLA